VPCTTSRSRLAWLKKSCPYDTLYVAFALALGANKVVVGDSPFATAMRAHPDPALTYILLPLAAWASERDG
jgi:hypothetical protein